MLCVSNEISGSSCTVALQFACPYQARLCLMHPICMPPGPVHGTGAPGKLGTVCALPRHGLSQPFGPRNGWFTGHKGTSRSCAYCGARLGMLQPPPALEVTLTLPLIKHQKEIKEGRDVPGCGLLLTLPQDPALSSRCCLPHEGLSGTRCCLPAPSAPCFPCPSLRWLSTLSQERPIYLSGSLSRTARRWLGVTREHQCWCCFLVWFSKAKSSSPAWCCCLPFLPITAVRIPARFLRLPSCRLHLMTCTFLRFFSHSLYFQ